MKRALLSGMASKILLIDEDSRLLTLVGDYLSNLGYEVHRACEADEAAALLKNYRYSIIIAGTEWENFEGSGDNLTHCIKSLPYHPSMVRLEETHSNPSPAPALGDGATVVIEKPNSLLRLETLMHELIVITECSV